MSLIAIVDSILFLVKKVLQRIQYLSILLPYKGNNLRILKRLGGEINTTLIALDSPGRHSFVFLDYLDVTGWAFSTVNHSLQIKLFIDGLEYNQYTTGIERPDLLAKFPHWPQVANCGFSEKLYIKHLTTGAHILKLHIKQDTKIVKELTRVFYLFHENELYHFWVRHQFSHLNLTKRKLKKMSVPNITIIVDCTRQTSQLKLTLNSIISQKFTHFTCVLVGLHDSEWLEVHSKINSDPRFAKSHSVEVSLEKLSTIDGYFLCVEPGEILDVYSILELLAPLRNSPFDIAYSDHDEINQDGQHQNPEFTFSWSPDHLLARNYIGGIFIASNKLLSGLIGIKYTKDWRYELLMELGQRTTKITRVPKVLWSRLLRNNAAQDKENELEAVYGFLKRNVPKASVALRNNYRYIDWGLQVTPKVSIIIPTTGNPDLIIPCVASIMDKTEYRNFEMVILDNGHGKYPSGINYLKERGLKVIECNETFNWSRLNNIGTKQASGELLLFLNDDIEVFEGSWLHELVKLAIRNDIGTVGPKLYYGNGNLQHAGILLVNYGGGALHLFHNMIPGDGIYKRLDHITREVSANTGACLMVSRKKYDEVGGFDESLTIVGNDVDFCLRLKEMGCRNIWTPNSMLIHHESISRKSIENEHDVLNLWKRWGNALHKGDPYYNPNLSILSGVCRTNLSIPKKIVESHYGSNFRQTTTHSEIKQTAGVNLFGYIRAEMGLGESIRSSARSLHESHVPFCVINFETGNPGRMTDLTWVHKEVSEPIYDVNLIHINPDHFEILQKQLPNYFFQKQYNIGYWAWELKEIPEEWLASFVYVDEVWVPSKFVKTALEKVATFPVYSIPHSIDIEPEYEFSRTDFNLPDQAFMFLTMFDTRSIAERKNPYGVLKAFQHAFDQHDERVCLVLKINNADPIGLSKLKTKIKDWKNIVLIDSTHSRQHINALLTCCDCFVSLHRSEGFGLGPAEAMCLGKPVIITNWSGNTDYMTPQNCLPVSYTLVEIENDYGPYKKGQVWAEPNVEVASKAMQKLKNDPLLAKEIGEKGRQTIKENFAPSVIGNLIRKRLDDIHSSYRKCLYSGVSP